MRNGIYYLYYFHFPLWIIKDSSWFVSLNFDNLSIFKYFSLSFGIITLIVSIVLTIYSKTKLSLYENLIISFWLLANFSWMLSEVFYLHIAHNLAMIFFLLGFFVMPLFITEIFKNKEINFLKKY